MSEKEGGSDFRYDTGETKVPWAAVGESVNTDDIARLIGMLIKPGEDEQAYQKQFDKLRKQLKKLKEKGRYASKLSLGNQVKELESKTKDFLDVKHACFLTNATAGFEIGFKFCGIQPGDEVIAPAITFLSTISYPLQIGARVVLADVDPKTINMDPADVERRITDRTKAIIPVHIGGYPVDMDPIMKIARDNDIMVIEDAAHAFGAEYKGTMVGCIGDFGSYSFHEVKNITSLGEGGILVTNTDYGEYFAQARFGGFDISNPINKWLYDVTALKAKNGLYVAAGNHSSTEAQAVVLLSQLERLEEIIRTRRENAEYLNTRFESEDGLVPPPLDTDEIKSSHHLYLLQVDPDVLNGDIQDFKKRLDGKGVTQIPHFAPLYRFSYMKQLGYDTEAMQKSCPNAEEAFLHRFTHLPLYPLTKEQLRYMADAVVETAKEMRR